MSTACARLAVLFAVASVVLSFVPAAGATPPANDAFASATAIASFPFSDSISVDYATMEPGEALGPCAYGSLTAQTWYALTPAASGLVRISDSAWFYFQFISAYRQDGVGLSGLTNVACAAWSSGGYSTTQKGKNDDLVKSSLSG